MIRGLDPERAARLAPLMSECQRVLVQDGMEAVQRLLAMRQVDVMDSIIVTLDLVEAGPGAVGRAKEMVLLSRARATQLERHDEWVSGLLNAVKQSEDADPV
ncbi:hypothetical protein [Actinoallomurus sp. CA-150999]|uniref:hypothetical protein n=1 Tax=Actinoallomurus sp. CA-150999 TaxID=3239887 RepID=UPI003D90195E